MDAKEDIKTLKVVELRDKLRHLGLPAKGKKQELVARLFEALQSENGSGRKKRRAAEETADISPVQERKKKSKVGQASENVSAGVDREKPWSHFNSVEEVYAEILGNGKVYPLAKRVQSLEFHGFLEEVLLPEFDQGQKKTSFMVSMMLILNEKFERALPAAWESVTCRAEGMFDQFFKQILFSLYAGSFTTIEATCAIKFLSNAVQSLENTIIRPNVMRLCSLALWSKLPQDRRQIELKHRPELERKWKHLLKKEDRLKNTKLESSIFDSIEAKFLPWIVEDLIETIRKYQHKESTNTLTCIKATIIFLKDVISQLPTRRFFVIYLVRCNFRARLQCCDAMHRFDENTGVQACLSSLFDCMDAAIDTFTGEVISHDQAMQSFYGYTQLVERVFFNFWEDLREASYSAPKDLCSPDTMNQYLAKLSDNDLKSLVCNQLKLATTHDFESHGRRFLEIVFKDELKLRSPVKRTVENMPIYPNEKLITDKSLISGEFDEVTGLVYSMPKLNLQFLSMPDYLERNFTLYLAETGYDISQTFIDVIKRLAPYTNDAGKPDFSGWSKMSQHVEGFSMAEVRPSNVGWTFPALVTAEFSITISAMPERLKREWDQLKQHDILFLVSFQDDLPSIEDVTDDLSYLKSCVKLVRGCEIRQVRDEEGNPMNCFTEEGEWVGEGQGCRRTLTVEFDPVQYHNDVLDGNSALYSRFDIVIRRNAKENNFKSVLKSIRDALINESISGDILPPWLSDTFLGYGNPNESTFLSMGDKLVHCLDYRDTFVSKEHITESFPNHSIEFNSTEPPFRVTFCTDESLTAACGVREQAEQHHEIIIESSYSNRRNSFGFRGAGNAVRFTPTQVNAITRALQQGLTLIVGPPGSGKTDVAVQILHGLYHNNANERTLIITHSNQALNDIFQKLSQKDINIGEMLRLGYGENLLETEEEYGKLGRVNAMLERRMELLAEIHALAESLGVRNVGEFTCETAVSFWKMHVIPRWEKYLSGCKAAKDPGNLVSQFPFLKYSAGKNIIINDEASIEHAFAIISRIFDELEGLRPFEVLTSQKNRINYMLTKQAKVIAMTCTHAAIKRQEFLDLGFSFDNVLMEEAAQILDIESILPITMQRNAGDKCRLKRLIMIGDHFQLPPVVKNPLLKNYCRFEQSLFTRLIRLNTPYIQLNAQGRSRPSLAKLYSWRYQSLENLPRTSMGKFAEPNPGFAFVCQFVNVDNFLGKGETQSAPHFYQNLGEAEYIVLVYQYMRLLGYEAKKISILTTYNGQYELLTDILEQKCAGHPLFGMPASISTVDRYQGQQNDFVLLSLVRTRHVGHLRDVRRLVVALSRARLGLYIFGRLQLFAQCQELKPAFDQLRAMPTQLALVEGEHAEMDISRAISEVPNTTLNVQDVSHMASIVKNMEGEWRRQNSL